MKLLYLPNEDALELTNHKLQVGPRKAFEALHEKGALSGLEIYSFLHELKKSGSHQEVMNQILAIAEKFQPDVIYWHHVSHFKLNDDFFVKLKEKAPKAKNVYHEPDPYGRFIKRINENMRLLFSKADLTIMSGAGNFIKLAQEAGAKNVIFSVQHFDNIRVGRPWTPTETRENDLVMIANAAGYIKIPGRYIPGSQRRIELGKKLSESFGRRFALYGNGWDGLEAARGRLEFNLQEQTIRSSWVSINWQHFDKEPFYFSNRIPISLASGVPHITNYQPGYDFIFKNLKGGLYMAKTVDEAVEIAHYLLSQPKAFLLEEGQKARDFAFANLETNVVYENIVQKLKEILFKQ